MGVFGVCVVRRYLTVAMKQLFVVSLSPSRTDSVTVFVSNLPFGTKSSEIQSLFVSCGDIVDIRTVRSGSKGKAKKPFAYAYVQFSTEVSGASLHDGGSGWTMKHRYFLFICLCFCLQAAVQKALMHDRVSFHGRQVYVSPCSGDKKQGGETAPVARVRPCNLSVGGFYSNIE